MRSEVVIFFGSLIAIVTCQRYQPNWDSLDTRPLPPWYDESKIGLLICWGVYAVPSYSTEWFWWQWQGLNMSSSVQEYMRLNYPPDFTYIDFAAQFTAEFYDPEEWANIFNASGARYVVLTTKHHDGYTLWPSKVSWNWNSMDIGPKRDLVGDLANAIRKKTKLHFGVYHSLFEWFHPLWLRDVKNNFTTQDFVAAKAMPELYELVNNYLPDVVWSDGDWLANDTYWNSTQFLAWLFNDSPVKDTVVVNDRWGKNCNCRHGSFFNCEDKYRPGTLPGHKWEDSMSIDNFSWSYRRTAKVEELYSIDGLIALLVETISLGGNLLVDVGPTAEGEIPPIFEERLRQMGQWLKVNGEAIYSTKPWIFQKDTFTPGLWYTAKNTSEGEVVYAMSLTWYGGDELFLGAPVPDQNTTVSLIGYPGYLEHMATAPTGMTIHVPPVPINKMPCDWAWVFKLERLKNRRK